MRREVGVDGKRYVVTLTSEGLRLVEKGRRKGIEITWKQSFEGEVELHAQIGGLFGALRAFSARCGCDDGADRTPC